MKYIRTKDGIYEFVDFKKTEGMRCANHYGYRRKDGLCILGELKDWKEERKADTIEELCDEFIMIGGNASFTFRTGKYGLFDGLDKSGMSKSIIKELQEKGYQFYGAIWTEWGLKYVAKTNDKGELELL